jgi:alpha-glucosidase
MQPKMRHTGEKPVNPLILTVYPGEAGSTRVYEDAGNTLGYKTNEFTRTAVRFTRQNSTMKITIEPVQGSYPGMLLRRGYQVRLVGSWPANTVNVNGKALPGSAIQYDGNQTTAIVTLPEFDVHQRVEITVTTANAPLALLNGVPGKLARLRSAMDTLNGAWPKDWSPDSLVHAMQTGERMRLHPETAVRELEGFQSSFGKVLADIDKMNADAALKQKALGHLQGIIAVESSKAAH